MNSVPSADVNGLLAKLNASPDLSDTEKNYLRDQLTTRRKYGLVWEDKPEAVEQQLLNNLPVLTEVPERRIISAAVPDERPTGTPAAHSVSTSRPVATQAATPQLPLAFDSEKPASLVDC